MNQDLRAVYARKRWHFSRFAKLANSPKLKFWMSQLELEYHEPWAGRDSIGGFNNHERVLETA